MAAEVAPNQESVTTQENGVYETDERLHNEGSFDDSSYEASISYVISKTPTESECHLIEDPKANVNTSENGHDSDKDDENEIRVPNDIEKSKTDPDKSEKVPESSIIDSKTIVEHKTVTLEVTEKEVPEDSENMNGAKESEPVSPPSQLTVHTLQTNDIEIDAEDDLEDPSVILSNEEAQLLEKLKYQPFDVAQELQNLTSQQREKIHMYQRRESLARGNSLKRQQSPSSSISMNKRPSTCSSQGGYENSFSEKSGNVNETGTGAETKLTAGEGDAVEEKRDDFGGNVAEERDVGVAGSGLQLGVTEEGEGEGERDDSEMVDINSNVYQHMRLITPRPYKLSNDDSTAPTTPTHSGEKSKLAPQRYSTLPVSYKMSSEGDLLSNATNDANQKLDRSNSVKAQEDIDKMRQNVYEMRMKFLGLEIPAVYPYKSISYSPGIEHSPEGDTGEIGDGVDDEVILPSGKSAKLESANNANLFTGSKSNKNTSKAAAATAPTSKMDDEGKDGSNKKKPSPFYKLLCGSGKAKNNNDD